MVTDSVWNRDPEFESDGFIIGIDFGTSNSCASIWCPSFKGVPDRVKVIKDITKRNRKLTPSNIYFDTDEFAPLVGFELDHDSIVSLDKFPPLHAEAKLLLGKDDKSEMKCTNTTGKVRSIAAIDLCSYIIQYVHAYASSYIEKNYGKLQNPVSVGVVRRQISGAVIGIPVGFSTSQVSALEAAAHKAGIPKVTFLSESTAAALSYGLLVAGSKTVAVFDIGGGTTDVSVLRISEGGLSEVVAREGDSSCGGRDYDRAMMDLVISKLLSQCRGKHNSKNDSVVLLDITNALKNESPASYSQLAHLCSRAKVSKGKLLTKMNLIKSIFNYYYYFS